MGKKKRSEAERDAALLRGFSATKTPERRATWIVKVCREAADRAPALLARLRARCGSLAFDDHLTACLFRDAADERTFLVDPQDGTWQELSCDPFDELEWVGWSDRESVFVGRRQGDDRFYTVSVFFNASSQLIFTSLGELKKAEYRKLKKGERWPPNWEWSDAAQTSAAPKKPPVVRPASSLAERLGSESYVTASDALRELVNLPPESRDEWIPVLLDHLGRFSNNSEWCWIIDCLPPHFQRHRERIEPALRKGLKEEYAFAALSVLECLHQLGPAGAALLPDVLAYIGRQGAFTNEEPHLIHLDPTGEVAIPGLIRLLGSRQETVRYQVVSELEAYGSRAASAIPHLTKLASSNAGGKRTLEADAAQRALDAIHQSP
jgi:hypothetical protein